MSRLELISKFFLALASSLFLLIGGIAVPPAGVILIPLVPQPVLSFGLKHGRQWALGLLGSAGGLLLIFGGIELAIVYSLFGFMVVLLFMSLDRGRSIEAVVVGSAGGMFAAVSVLMLASYGSWTQMVEDLRAGLTNHLELSFRFYEKMGLSDESIAVLKERTPQIVETILEIMPALIFITFGLIVLVNVYLICRRFPERRASWVSTGNLHEWKGPEWLVWALIASGFALFVSSGEALKFLALNVLLVTAVFYFFQGLAIVAYYFHKKNVPRFLRGLTYVLIVFEQIFTLLVVGLGLFDLWGDFRRLNKKDLNPSQAS